MKKYLLFITLALIAVPLVTAGCTSPSNPSPSPSIAPSTAASSTTTAVSTPSASPSAAASVTPTPTPAANQQIYAISIVDFAFQPSTMTIPQGATVRWQNNAPTTHTVTSNSGAFSSGNLGSGGTFTHQFTQAGTYAYHCSIHPSMTATIIVQ